MINDQIIVVTLNPRRFWQMRLFAIDISFEVQFPNIKKNTYLNLYNLNRIK